MVELGSSINPEVGKKASRLNMFLAEYRMSCNLRQVGVIHEGKPTDNVLGAVENADVITLELTRGVVNAGMTGEASLVLSKNQFWAELIDYIRKNPDGKIVKGVDVAQAPCFAMKRLNFEMGSAAYAQSFATLQVKEEDIRKLGTFLTEEEMDTLRKYKWLGTSSAKALDAFADAANVALEDPKKENGKLKLDENILIADYSDNPDLGRHSLTFVTHPHQSVMETVVRLEGIFSKLPYVPNDQLWLLVYNTISTFMLTYSEVSQALEILGAANQFVRNNRLRGKTVEGVHVGNAAHLETIGRILAENSSGLPKMHTSADYQTGLSQRGYLFSFFRDTLSVQDRLDAVTVQNYEVYMNTDLVCRSVEDAIKINEADFEKRVKIYEDVRSRHPDMESTEEYRAILNESSELYSQR